MIAQEPGFIPSKKSMELFGDEPPLIRLGVRVTQYCNLHCPYCSADASLLMSQEIPPSGVINTEFFKSALNQAADLGSMILEITGGEPFLYKDLVDVLKYADDLGYMILIATNGTLLKKNAAKTLAKLEGLNNLQITLDGSRHEIHDLTRGKGTFTKIVDAIKILTNHNIPIVINTVVNKLNIHDIENIASLSYELRAKAYKASIMSCFGRGELVSDKISVELEDVIKLAHRIYTLFQEYKGEMLVGSTVPLCLMSDDLRYYLLDISACNVLIHAGLNWNGDVGPCVYYLGPGKRYIIGNLRKQQLGEIWLSGKFKSFRRMFNKSLKLLESRLPCSVCIRKNVCYGGCPADAFHKTGKLAYPLDICFKLYEKRKYRWIITKGWSINSFNPPHVVKLEA